METLVEDDLRYLENIEDRLAKLEAAVLSDKLEGFMYSIVDIRKEILARSHYYSQLSDVALELLENENEIFDDHSLRLLKHFSDRAHRLRQETQMLREYSLQISEAYQTQIDIRPKCRNESADSSYRDIPSTDAHCRLVWHEF